MERTERHDRLARERTLRRSKAVAAAASFGGFASLVAVLVAHPVSSSAASSGTATSATSSSGPSSSSSTGQSTDPVPDTVTQGS